MMRTFFNRPLVMTLLMLVAGATYLFIRFDGFQKRHIFIPALAEEVKFLEADSKLAFQRQAIDWLQSSGYDVADEGWKKVTGKAASSQGTGVREDLQVYVKKVSPRSYQAWGLAPTTNRFKLVQVYRAMVVSEWTQEKADEYRDLFEKDAGRIKNLAKLGRAF